MVPLPLRGRHCPAQGQVVLPALPRQHAEEGAEEVRGRGGGGRASEEEEKLRGGGAEANKETQKS